MGVTPGAPRHIAGELDSGGRKDHAEPLASKTRRHRGHSSTQAGDAPECELSPMSRKIEGFDKYTRKDGQWSWKRPTYERSVVSLIKTERKMEEGIATALTEVEAVEAGLRYFDELILPKSRRMKSPTTECVEGGVRPWLASSELQTSKSNRPPKLSKPVAGKHLPLSSAEEGSEKAVKRYGDLKLTLRQRLKNYDLQRGMDIQPSEEGASDTLALARNDPKESDSDNKPEGCRSLPRTDAKICGTICERDAGDIPAPCEGGLADRGGVQGILARSLGNAVMAVRRASKEGRSLRGVSGSSGEIEERFRWRSWQETPPFVLASARTMEGVARKDSPRTARKSGGEAARSQARGKRMSVSCPTNGRILDVSGNAEGSAAIVSASDVANFATSGKAPLSSSGSSSSGKASRQGTTPVPRVATLADEINARKKLATDNAGARRTKDFDPDKLECVRRHEASVTEQTRKLQSLRAEVEKRSLFRARPLPSFLGGAHYGTSGLEGGSLPIDDTASGVDDVGTKPDLLTALNQDKEARELIDKIKKINPRVNIASIIFSSTPGPRAVRENDCLQEAILKCVTPPTGNPNARSGCSFDASKVAIGGNVVDYSKPEMLSNEHHQKSNEPTRSSPPDGDDKVLAPREQTQAVTNPVGTGRGWQVAVRRGITDGVEGKRRVNVTPRSLMGKMLGSGMLERQKEWSKERRTKVMESRRKAEEAKEREARDDILEAGFSERSWSNAKVEHLQSLERQKAEEELREQLRKARLRASAARAQRKREASEKMASALAAELAEADAVVRKSRTVTISEGETPWKPRRRRRPTSQANDGEVTACVTESRRERQRGRSGTQAVNDGPNAFVVDRLSEDDFYRVAVEKIMEKDSKAASATEECGGDRAGNALATGAFFRIEKPGSKGGDDRDAARVTCRLRDRTGRSSKTGLGYDGSNSQGSKCSTYASRGCAKRETVEGQVRRRRGPDVRRATVRRFKTNSDKPPLARPEACEENGFRKLSSSGGSRQVGHSDSLLSLFEAQSVEHYTEDSDFVRHAIGGCMEGPNVVEGGSMERSSVQKGISAVHPWGRGDTCNVGRRPQETVEETRDIVLSDFPWSEGKTSKNQDSDTYPENGKCELKEGPAEVESPRKVAESDRWERRLRLPENKLLRRTGVALEEDDDKDDDDVLIGKTPQFTEDEFKPQHALMLQQPTIRSHAITPSEGSWDDVLSIEKKEPNDEDFAHLPSCDLGYPLERGTITTRSDKRPVARRLDDDDIIVRHKGRWHRPSCVAHNFTVHHDYPGSDDATEVVVTSTQSRKISRDNIATSKMSVKTGGLDYKGQAASQQFSGTGQDVKAGESVILDASRSIYQVDDTIEDGDIAPSPFGRLGQPFFDPVTSSADKGRFKVRDPRHFDPCSMRRTQDFIVKSESVNATCTSWASSDGRTATAGVTLLKGRRVTEDCVRREGGGKEKVITVMFDRSKFNEQEAQRWWALNCGRIEGDQRHQPKGQHTALFLLHAALRSEAAPSLSVILQSVDNQQGVPVVLIPEDRDSCSKVHQAQLFALGSAEALTVVAGQESNIGRSGFDRSSVDPEHLRKAELVWVSISTTCKGVEFEITERAEFRSEAWSRVVHLHYRASGLTKQRRLTEFYTLKTELPERSSSALTEWLRNSSG